MGLVKNQNIDELKEKVKKLTKKVNKQKNT